MTDDGKQSLLSPYLYSIASLFQLICTLLQSLSTYLYIIASLFQLIYTLLQVSFNLLVHFCKSLSSYLYIIASLFQLICTLLQSLFFPSFSDFRSCVTLQSKRLTEAIGCAKWNRVYNTDYNTPKRGEEEAEVLRFDFCPADTIKASDRMPNMRRGGFFLACEDFGRMFDHSFPVCAFFSCFSGD